MERELLSARNAGRRKIKARAVLSLRAPLFAVNHVAKTQKRASTKKRKTTFASFADPLNFR